MKAIRGWSIDTLIFDEATELGDEIIDLASYWSEEESIDAEAEEEGGE